MMLNFGGMGKKGVVIIALVFILIFVTHTCNGSSSVFHLRKLLATEPNSTSQVPPTASPVNESNTNPMNAGKPQEEEEEKQKESPTGNQSNSGNGTVPIDSKGSNKTDNHDNNSGERNDNAVDKGSGKEANATAPKLGDSGSCKGSLSSCRAEGMLACIQASKDGSKGVSLIVKNEGEITLKVKVNLPNYLKNDLPALEVPKHQTKRMDISLSAVGKNTELIVSSGNAKCVLHLVNPVSVDSLIQQFSLYSKQVTPIYAVYGSFLLVLFFGGTWACCKLRKKNQQDRIAYQEIEMGLPESAPAVNMDATNEGWDHDWDDDDWEGGDVVKSPGGHQVRSVSADGLTSRPSKKDGWEYDWDD